MVYIYTLSDPTTGAVRYVGKTINPDKRYYMHCHPSTYRKNKSHVSHWVRKLISEGSHPVLAIIEEVEDSIWFERECYWIDYYRNLGYDLTNITKGGPYGGGKGEQAGNSKLTYPEVRKIKEALRNFPALTYHHGFKELGEKYGVSLSTIHFIYSGRVWTHVPGGPPFPERDRRRVIPEKIPVTTEYKNKNKLVWSDVVEIKKLIYDGIPYHILAEMFSVTESTISTIKTGARWGNVKVPLSMPEKRHKTPNITEEQKNILLSRLKCLEPGETLSSLEKSLGINKSIVYYWAKKWEKDGLFSSIPRSI